jgi:hypothetical protein
MDFEFVGVEMDEEGPKGVVARLMRASIDGDQEAGLAMMTTDSREGMKLHGPPIESGQVIFGEVTVEDGFHIVPTTTEGEGVSEPLEFVLREEENEYRVDMNATMARAMGGVSPNELMEGMADAMGGAMEQMGEAIAGAFQGLAGGPSEEVEVDPSEVASRTWMIAGGLTSDTILAVGAELASRMPGWVEPGTEASEPVESGDGTTRFVTVRIGDEDRGFERVTTHYEAEGMASRSELLTAYGLPEGLALSLTCAETALPDGQTVTNASVSAAAPEDSLESIEIRIRMGLELAS